MNITIVGAGNIGLAITAYLSAHKEHRITLFTNKKFDFLFVNDIESNNHVRTENFKVTNSISAFSNADYILCTYPAFLRKKLIENYGMYIRKGAKLGFIPGYGGAEYFCKELISRGIVVFGLQRVPFVARANKNEAKILSKKEKLYISSIPSDARMAISKEIENMLDIPTVALKDYLSITLTPTNPIIHIAGLWGAFKDYNADEGYTGKSGFYDQWNDDTSNIMFEYDFEVQEICKHLNMFDLSSVVSLPVYYESDTPHKLTQKLKSIEAFKVVQVPLKKNNDKLIVDLQNRMFIEDYPYGVVIYKDIANLLNLKTPTIDKMLLFYEKLSGIKYDFNKNKCLNKETGAPTANGLETCEALIDFYRQ